MIEIMFLLFEPMAIDPITLDLRYDSCELLLQICSSSIITTSVISTAKGLQRKRLATSFITTEKSPLPKAYSIEKNSTLEVKI